MTDREVIKISPQEWFQMKFLSCPADVVVWWGKAWAGKTFSLLLEPLRYITNTKWFGGVIFRRETPEITNQWWLRDASMEIYSYIWWNPKIGDLSRQFDGGNRLQFRHLEQEKDIFKRQWTNVPFIGFDELTHFTKKQFFYLLSRNRSTCGIKPYLRATTNPDPDSRVKELIDWWIDPKTWFIIRERDWVIRYFTVDKNQVIRWDTKQEVIDQCPHLFTKEVLGKSSIDDLVKSFTFIEWDIYENRALLSKDPAYLANLYAQDEIERKKLLEWNRHVTANDMGIYDNQSIEDLFTNFVEESDLAFITCDVARFGRDLAIIMVWNGRLCHTISIWTKSSTITLHDDIEKWRQLFKVPTSHSAVDQDWVGWWVVDIWWYYWFSGGMPALEDPKTWIKENYANVKTQCYYRSSDRINASKMSVSLDNIYVNWIKTNIIKIWESTFGVKELIKKQLRCIKRKNPDKEWKKQINTKEEQKIILWWMSPDFADTIMMREVFDLINVRPQFKIRAF